MAYQLEKYRNRDSRHTCPKCGKPKCFTYYVDEDGQPLDKSVGRCDHESECGYHYPPKDFFRDHPNREVIEARLSPNRITAKVSHRNKSIDTIPMEYVTRSRSNNSHLIRFLFSLQKDNEPVLKQVLDDYHVGVTRNGETIFWQIDKDKRVHGGKIIAYNKEDGHRIKDKGVNWVHSLLKKQGVLNEEWTLSQCLFGEHLLSSSANRDKVVAVVESEKTAIICAVQYPDCVWLATGGKSQLAIDKMKVLAYRSVVFFPDVDGYQEWLERTRAFSFCRSVRVSDVLEQNVTEADRMAKIDIADLVLREWQSLRQYREDTPLARAQRMIREMTERKPALQTLIDSLGLVPVVDDG